MSQSSTVTTDTTEREYWPENLEQAKEWITQLRESYYREVRYREKLEHELARQRDVVQFAVYWARARGIHRTRWLERWKGVASLFASEQGERPVGVLPG